METILVIGPVIPLTGNAHCYPIQTNRDPTQKLIIPTYLPIFNCFIHLLLLFHWLLHITLQYIICICDIRTTFWFQRTVRSNKTMYALVVNAWSRTIHNNRITVHTLYGPLVIAEATMLRLNVVNDSFSTDKISCCWSFEKKTRAYAGTTIYKLTGAFLVAFSSVHIKTIDKLYLYLFVFNGHTFVIDLLKLSSTIVECSVFELLCAIQVFAQNSISSAVN